MNARARIWFEVHTAGSARQQRQARADWYAPGKAARVLAEVRQALVLGAAQGRGLRTSAGASAWARDSLARGRARYIGRARDLLYHMRQARAAGVLRVRVPA